MKIGIIVDSSCGLTKNEANKRGWGFLPLIMNINGKDIHDGIDFTPEEFYKQLNINDEVRTSATPPALIIEEFEKFSKQYDLVIAYGISTELSSQTSNMKTFSKDFPNVHVVNSKGVATPIVYDLENLEAFAQKQDDKNAIIDYVEDLTNKQWGIAIPETLKWLVKGGRINPSVAGMANLLKIVPIISFSEGKLEKHGVGRVFKKSIINSAIEVKEKSRGGKLVILHAGNQEIDGIKTSVEKAIGQEIEVKYFPPVISLHTGPGTVAVITTRK